jgi:aryl-phospho-beta-D-glucosidase BglC (GH1 family)
LGARRHLLAMLGLLLSFCLLLPATAAPRRNTPWNPLHTRGSEIVDSTGKPVTLMGVSWWGMETKNFAPMGLEKRSVDSVLAEVSAMGFNTLRLPYSNELLRPGAAPMGINYELNPELKGAHGVELLDAMIAAAGRHGLRVVLDRHRPDAEAQSELWYTAEHSEQEWIADWMMLAERYSENDVVIGADLHNEPHGRATWGSGEVATDWRLAAERAGDAILKTNPHWLIFVQGVATVGSDTYWWGGNLTAAEKSPIRLDVPGQLVYAPHDYPPSVSTQWWFEEAGYPANLPEIWEKHWGYLAARHEVPVVMGEFGSRLETNEDRAWMMQMVWYLKQRHISALWWSLNPESEDTGGLYDDDWSHVEQAKMTALQPLLQAGSGALQMAMTRKSSVVF